MKNNVHQAIIFDLNGTMVDDMKYHTEAWHSIINGHLGGDISLEALKKEMYGKNEELLVRVFGTEKFTTAQMQELSLEKERRYQEAFLPQLKLIDGLPQFLERAKENGIKMGIGSAAILFNIDFVLDNLGIRHYFDAIVSADDVQQSKPDPETFLKVAAALGVDPKYCTVFEDAPKGVEAAAIAGMHSVVLTTMHQPIEFDAYKNILFFINDYTDDKLNIFWK